MFTEFLPCHTFPPPLLWHHLSITLSRLRDPRFLPFQEALDESKKPIIEDLGEDYH